LKTNKQTTKTTTTLESQEINTVEPSDEFEVGDGKGAALLL